MKTNNKGGAGTTALVIFGILAVITLMIYGFIKGNYNDFVTSEIRVEESWGAVESQYQRRFDLVPSLVESTKGIFEQEREVFGAIAEARTQYTSAKERGLQEEQVQATQQYESALARLLIVVENYPELRSADSVASLMDELAGTENRINISRDRYNAQVSEYNQKIVVFPRNLIANMFDFDKKAFFESESGAAKRVEVDFNLDK